MTYCKPCLIPVDTKTKLAADDSPPVPDLTYYRSLAGALQYLTFTCPDISYVHQSSITGLIAYYDVDWAGCPFSRWSTSGYCVFLGDNLISWSAKRQNTISQSSVESEYRRVTNVVAELTWIRQLLQELGISLAKASVVYYDNVSAVYMSTNLIQHQRTKHIEIDIHFVREKVALGQVKVVHVPSALQYADIFTKGLPVTLFEDFRSSLSVRKPTDNAKYVKNIFRLVEHSYVTPL